MYRRNGPDLNLFESPSVTNSSDVPDSGFLIVYSTKLKLKKTGPRTVVATQTSSRQISSPPNFTHHDIFFFFFSFSLTLRLRMIDITYDHLPPLPLIAF